MHAVFSKKLEGLSVLPATAVRFHPSIRNMLGGDKRSLQCLAPNDLKVRPASDCMSFTQAISKR